MNVNLIKEADFEFDENKYKPVDKEIFDMLVEPNEGNNCGERLPDLIFFKDKEEYKNRAGLYEIDGEKPIYVNDKKQVFCFLKSR